MMETCQFYNKPENYWAKKEKAPYQGAFPVVSNL
jgi:hypothetical protein